MIDKFCGFFNLFAALVVGVVGCATDVTISNVEVTMLLVILNLVCAYINLAVLKD